MRLSLLQQVRRRSGETRVSIERARIKHRVAENNASLFIFLTGIYIYNFFFLDNSGKLAEIVLGQ